MFRRRWSAGACLGLGLLLAALPWLHQKYVPLWAALCVAAALVAVQRLAPGRRLLALLLPQGLTLLGLLALNLAQTGSPRPDALFRALGRSGVGLDTLRQGLAGLWLDARYGLLPFVPWLLLAGGGLALRASQARWLARALPLPAAYYLTVAAAENWTGSISNLGRFLTPVVPVLAAFAALALERLWTTAGGRVLVLALLGWSAACARLLWLDPAAANDSGVLLARSRFADGHVYLPNLLLRSWSDAAPGLPAQLCAWAALALALAWGVRRAAEGRGCRSVPKALAALVALPLLVAAGLERWPGARRAARFEGLPLADGGRVLLGPGCRAGDAEAWCEGGPLRLVVRSPQPVATLLLRVRAGSDRAPTTDVRVLLTPVDAGLVGRRGSREYLAKGRVDLSQPASLAPGR